MEIFGFAVGVIGLTPAVFWEMLPVEYFAIHEAYNEHQRNLIEMSSVAVKTAIASSFGKKNYTVFEEKMANKKRTVEDNKADLDFLKNKLG